MSEPTRTKLEPTLTALRERAVVLRQGRWSDGPEDAELMEHAADAIEGLESKNAKLREVLKLAAFVLETMEHVTSWRFEGDGKVFDSAYFYDYLRELGVTE